MHGLHTWGTRTPQGRLGHPFPQRLPAHRETFLGQVFGGQRGAEICITLPQSRQNLLLEPRRQPAVRGPTAQSMNQCTIPTLAKTQQHSPHVAVGYFQPLGGSYLRQMLLIYLVQHFQSVPFPLTQRDSLRFHGPLGHPWNRTFLLCTNRTFSFCGDTRRGSVDSTDGKAVRWRNGDVPLHMIGRTLGHYRIVEKIGAGGMGEIYRARDEQLDRDVALKVLPPGMLKDEKARRRFRNEALLLAKLNHPNIATVHEFDTEDGADFLVMECVAGTSLAQKLETGPLPEKELLLIATQVAQALEEAHERGIVHRDLKPGNIVIAAKDRAKVLDFGIAKLLRPAGDTDPTQSITAAHSGAGTLPYMSPEQLRGEAAGARSDIFSFGAVLYEMATGRRPCEETLPSRLIDAIVRERPVPPRLLNPKISSELERIILKCLEKEPENRYQSAKELEVDLRRLQTPSAVPLTIAAPTTPSPSLAKGTKVASVAIAIVLVLALVLGIRWWRERRAPLSSSTPIQSLAVLPLENLSGDPQQEYFAQGMTEELTTQLAQISALRVISRTSVTQYKNAKQSLPELGKRLHVDAVVEGSVMREGDNVRITAQLIEVSTDKLLWAQSYDRNLTDVLSLQEEVARAVASEVKVTLTPDEKARLASAQAVNPKAHDDYLEGSYLNKGTSSQQRKALRVFRGCDTNRSELRAGICWVGGLLLVESGTASN